MNVEQQARSATRAAWRTVFVLLGIVSLLGGAELSIAPRAVAAPTTSASRPAAAGYGDAEAILQRSSLQRSSTRALSPAEAADGSADATSSASSGATSGGYLEAAADGGVYAFGATNGGGLRGQHLNAPIVAMASIPNSTGYWLVASDGGIFSFGGAGFFGSEGGHPLNQPIVGMASTPNGGGYWLVAADGGIFSFGNAKFFGSEGGHPLNQPIVGMASTSNGGGYWLVASDGGIFSFGNAGFFGSTGSMHLNAPIVAMATASQGAGYRLFASDGGVFTFGDAPFLGSTGADPGSAPIVAAANSTYLIGYDISWPQCQGDSAATVPLPLNTGLSIVGASDGYIGTDSTHGEPYGPNPCLRAEAAWAGPSLQIVIVADPINAGDGPLSDTTDGPQSCTQEGANTPACGYNWGWNNALQAVANVHADGLHPADWWVDVELDEGWNFSDSAVNAQVIMGMMNALQSQGLTAGIYCTGYQWGAITGDYPLPGVHLWIPGAGELLTGTYSATAYCTEPQFDFAGGIPWIVQYGYIDGPPLTFDPDYSCVD